MKKANCIGFILCILFILLRQANAQNAPFVLSGEIKEQQNGFVSLTYINHEGKQVKDSSRLVNGRFRFKGVIKEPTMAMLRGAIKSIADDDPNAVGFYLEKGNLTAIATLDHFKKIKITGSQTQKEYEMLQRKYAAIDNNSDSLYEKFSKVSYDFIETNPNSYVSAFTLALYKSRWPFDSVKVLYTKLSPAIQNSNHGKAIAATIKEIEDSSPGKMAVEFTSTDINGKSISLSRFKGNYILLDFWASWCIPCRESTPHLKELYKTYHDKGMEIIGISDDYDTTAWRRAVEKDGTTIWYNILTGIEKDSNGIDDTNSINRKFGIQVLPTKILIDKKGVIIGRYTGTEEEHALDKKLSNIFK